MRLKIFFLVFSLIFLVNFVSADFSLGNKSYSIDKIYGPSAEISGWVNISFSDEPANSILQDSTTKSIKIIDLLKSNSDYFYGCTPSNCSNITAKINSGEQMLDLSAAHFSVPNIIGPYTFTLILNGKNVFTENVNVTEVPKINDLYPKSVSTFYPNLFIVDVNSSTSIDNFFWDFGDGEAVITKANSSTHTYNATGNYKLTLIVTNSKKAKSTKDFTISVVSPKNLVQKIINNTNLNIATIISQMSSWDAFTQESLNTTLKIDEKILLINQTIAGLATAQTDEDYNPLVKNVLLLGTLPNSVTESATADKIKFFPDKKNFDIDAIKKIGGGNYDPSRKDKYSEAIIFWNQKNIDSTVSSTEILGSYQGSAKKIFTVFSLDIKSTNNSVGDYYLIIPKMENLMFEDNSSASQDSKYVYFKINGQKHITFSTTENVDFTNLPAFISPAISKLTISDLSGITPQGKPNFKPFLWALFFLIIAAIIIYFILAQWYKRKYENYLFKNRNDLYNMVNYVNNSKKKGVENKEIGQNLKKAKWSSEQVRYVMKKYLGENTGLPEIPFSKFIKNPFKSFENQKKEIQSQQGQGIQ